MKKAIVTSGEIYESERKDSQRDEANSYIDSCNYTLMKKQNVI